MPPELIGLLQQSDNTLLHQIFTDKEADSTATKGLSKVTVVSKFKVGANLIHMIPPERVGSRP